MTFKITKAHLFTIIFFVLIFCGAIQFYSSAKESEKNELQPLPVVIYHQISKNANRNGKYCLSLKQLEDDLKYLKEKGYNTITTAQLLSHVYENAKLPENPIILTFDDGFESLHEYVLPLLKEMNMVAVAGVVGTYTDMYSKESDHNITYSYLTWEQVNTLVKSNSIEMLNHSYNLHKNNSNRNGVNICENESFEEYKKIFSTDIRRMDKLFIEKTDYKPTAFIYPFGCHGKESKEVLEHENYKAAYTCLEKMNYIDKKNHDWLYQIGRYNRDSVYSSKTFFEEVVKLTN